MKDATFSDLTRTKLTVGLLLRPCAWWIFWTLLVLYLYWPGITALPYKDHPIMMLNRQLADNDWEWFWSMLSYSRTRTLLPGDYFAFRPIHMAVIGLQDIFLRYHLTLQGVIDCLQFSAAAVVFQSLTRRLAGASAGFCLTFLWVPQLAGASLVIWLHITPYILCPAFFCCALICLDGDDLPISVPLKRLLAGACVFAACLTHEIGVMVAFIVSAIAVMACRNNRVRFREVLGVFIIPSLMALILNAIDFFVLHPPPAFMGPDDKLNSVSNSFILPFIGSIGTAMFAPAGVHMESINNGFPVWNFINEPSLLMNCMAVLVISLIAFAILMLVRETRNQGLARIPLALTLFLALFAATFTVCGYRMYSRDVGYMSSATYYYFNFSLALCGILASFFALHRSIWRRLTFFICLALGIWHATTLRTFLLKSEFGKKTAERVISRTREIISSNKSICFQGIIPEAVPQTAWGWLPFFHDISCEKRLGAEPLYLGTLNENPVLAAVEYRDAAKRFEQSLPPPEAQMPVPGSTSWFITRILPNGHDVLFSLNRAGSFGILIEDGDTDKQGFYIDRNTINRLPKERAAVNAVEWDPAREVVEYELRFVDQGILLFGKQQLLGLLPHFTGSPEMITLTLYTHSGRFDALTDFRIADTSAYGKIAIVPRYNLLPK